ncbi:DUF433 domain-containing protein [Salinarimonas sp.]|uniref:DUF433 domain-containing protein n=1 Tax=Salinarimonas sp. TaxID=2766526 RepID=UPI0032D90384
MSAHSTVISGFTEEQVTRLTGVSRRQMRYWAVDGFFLPSIDLSATGVGLRLYSFRDLVCLKVIAALRNEAKVPLSELRRAKERLRHLGDDLWAKTTLFVLGRRVVFRHDGNDALEEASTGQRVLEIPLRVVTGDMERAVRSLRRRESSDVGRIERKRHVAQNQPVVAGTRIPVRAVKDFHEAGYAVSEIREQYPTLTEEDVIAAIGYGEVA